MASPALRILIGTALTVTCPIFIGWSAVCVFIREIGRAFYYAWLEVRIEWASYLKLMKAIIDDDIQKR